MNQVLHTRLETTRLLMIAESNSTKLIYKTKIETKNINQRGKGEIKAQFSFKTFMHPKHFVV